MGRCGHDQADILAGEGPCRFVVVIDGKGSGGSGGIGGGGVGESGDSFDGFGFGIEGDFVFGGCQGQDATLVKNTEDLVTDQGVDGGDDCWCRYFGLKGGLPGVHRCRSHEGFDSVVMGKAAGPTQDGEVRFGVGVKGHGLIVWAFWGWVFWNPGLGMVVDTEVLPTRRRIGRVWASAQDPGVDLKTDAGSRLPAPEGWQPRWLLPSRNPGGAVCPAGEGFQTGWGH